MNRLTSFVLSILALQGCDTFAVPEAGGEYQLIISTSSSFTKTILPEEERINDVNLFIFNEEGKAEERMFLTAADMTEEGKALIRNVRLQKYKSYDIYAAANLGRAIFCDRMEELAGEKAWMAYADDFRNGIVMSGMVNDIRPGDTDRIELPLERALAKVRLSVDRRELDPQVDVHIKKVSLVSCPRYAFLFSGNSPDEFFQPGFTSSEIETAKLNRNAVSGEISLYCFENMNVERNTYVEVEADYNSDEYYTESGRYLKYRFFPDENGIRRNGCYDICMKLTGNGLGTGGWRIDTDALTSRGSKSWSIFHPSSYIECHVGDTVHLWCEYSPEKAVLDIDDEFLEEDVSRGIYDYRIDEDGKGLQLFMKGKGTGIVLFDIGEPVNNGAMYMIVCEP